MVKDYSYIQATSSQVSKYTMAIESTRKVLEAHINELVNAIDLCEDPYMKAQLFHMKESVKKNNSSIKSLLENLETTTKNMRKTIIDELTVRR